MNFRAYDSDSDCHNRAFLWCFNNLDQFITSWWDCSWKMDQNQAEVQLQLRGIKVFSSGLVCDSAQIILSYKVMTCLKGYWVAVKKRRGPQHLLQPAAMNTAVKTWGKRSCCSASLWYILMKTCQTFRGELRKLCQPVKKGHITSPLKTKTKKVLGQFVSPPPNLCSLQIQIISAH